MAEVINGNIAAIGMPAWTDEEVAFARELQTKAGVKTVGLETEFRTATGPAKQIAASNDSGDVSWKVPMGRIYFPGNIPEIPYHHWTAGAALATSIAHKGGLAGSQALTGSIIDFLRDPALVAKVKESFAREIGDVKYQSLIPEGQDPPVHLNEVMMEKHRPAMEQHYVKEPAEFSVGL
jgi:aminobenzoyl-glutamate utilization protein B